MSICWHLKEGFNADVIGGRGGGVLSLHYEIFHGDRYIQFNHVHDIYHVLNVLTCHFSFWLKL